MDVANGWGYRWVILLYFLFAFVCVCVCVCLFFLLFGSENTYKVCFLTCPLPRHSSLWAVHSKAKLASFPSLNNWPGCFIQAHIQKCFNKTINWWHPAEMTMHFALSHLYHAYKLWFLFFMDTDIPKIKFPRVI